jgi:hypothetical protein
MASQPDETPSQDIHPARDAFVAGGDFHYHASAERQVPLSAGPVQVGDLPQTPPAFQPRPELLAALESPGVVVVQAVTGMREWGRRSWLRPTLEPSWRPGGDWWHG